MYVLLQIDSIYHRYKRNIHSAQMIVPVGLALELLERRMSHYYSPHHISLGIPSIIEYRHLVHFYPDYSSPK